MALLAYVVPNAASVSVVGADPFCLISIRCKNERVGNTPVSLLHTDTSHFPLPPRARPSLLPTGSLFWLPMSPLRQTVRYFLWTLGRCAHFRKVHETTSLVRLATFVQISLRVDIFGNSGWYQCAQLYSRRCYLILTWRQWAVIISSPTVFCLSVN